MRIFMEYPDELDEEVLKAAREDGHASRSAVARKALGDFLHRKSQKVTEIQPRNDVPDCPPNQSECC